MLFFMWDYGGGNVGQIAYLVNPLKAVFYLSVLETLGKIELVNVWIAILNKDSWDILESKNINLIV